MPETAIPKPVGRSVAGVALRVIAAIGLAVCAGFIWVGGRWVIEDVSYHGEMLDGLTGSLSFCFLVLPAAVSAVALVKYLRQGRPVLLGAGLLALLIPVTALVLSAVSA